MLLSNHLLYTFCLVAITIYTKPGNVQLNNQTGRLIEM